MTVLNVRSCNMVEEIYYKPITEDNRKLRVLRLEFRTCFYRNFYSNKLNAVILFLCYSMQSFCSLCYSFYFIFPVLFLDGSYTNEMCGIKS